jgi:hypothetical protein
MSLIGSFLDVHPWDTAIVASTRKHLHRGDTTMRRCHVLRRDRARLAIVVGRFGPPGHRSGQPGPRRFATRATITTGHSPLISGAAPLCAPLSRAVRDNPGTTGPLSAVATIPRAGPCNAAFWVYCRVSRMLLRPSATLPPRVLAASLPAIARVEIRRPFPAGR